MCRRRRSASHPSTPLRTRCKLTISTPSHQYMEPTRPSCTSALLPIVSLTIKHNRNVNMGCGMSKPSNGTKSDLPAGAHKRTAAKSDQRSSSGLSERRRRNARTHRSASRRRAKGPNLRGLADTSVSLAGSQRCAHSLLTPRQGQDGRSICVDAV